MKKKVNASVMDKLENAENEYVELNKKKLVSTRNGHIAHIIYELLLDWCICISDELLIGRILDYISIPFTYESERVPHREVDLELNIILSAVTTAASP